ncbi:hypothetical protein LAZ67_9001786 [Cordylochernes scorpioides]|uniref:HTH CENPB-type domain-containing protein n=1 Tax=Cordylochernes scorpioides TaxID=51811 RepID=A0ABY6KVA8_9ARAC|nr:hypothetical protein LAZ67_9001786 [Cordylochernes scorpioides]
MDCQIIPTVANKYGISQTQVKTLINKKEEFNQNSLLKRKIMNKSIKFDEVNDLVWKFFTDMKSRNIYVSGPMLQEQALKFVTGLKFPKFSASNGWLESFRSRYGIIFGSHSGETGDVKRPQLKIGRQV